ncbi:MAG TPA: co-chaperone GroES [Candidatus Paceibacterota bacterium]
MKKNISLKAKAHMGLRPLADRVLVEPLNRDDETLTKSGIIIPETVDKEKPYQGKVLAVGPGKYEDGKLTPMTVRVGDKVVFSKYSPDEIKINDKEYYIISESSILAVLE